MRDPNGVLLALNCRKGNHLSELPRGPVRL